MVMPVTLALLSLGPTLPPILEARPALIVLGAGGRKPAELEMALIEHPLALDQGEGTGT